MAEKSLLTFVSSLGTKKKQREGGRLGRPSFEEMEAVNVKKWSAAASVAAAEDLMDCSMSHVGGGGGKKAEGRRKGQRGEVEWVSWGSQFSLTRCSSKFAIFRPERLTNSLAANYLRK